MSQWGSSVLALHHHTHHHVRGGPAHLTFKDITTTAAPSSVATIGQLEAPPSRSPENKMLKVKRRLRTSNTAFKAVHQKIPILSR